MVTLTSFAEKQADKVRNLPEFRDVALLGIKEQVANMLKMIGKVEGIFSTYTAHDISHVDAMLEMLEWIVPPETQEKMTPVDWLLIVLAVYLHDLGMVVTDREYKDRKSNPAFCKFRDNLFTEQSGEDFLARLEKMTDDEKERFLYQEFVRLKHASRIKEWITCNHSIHWGDSVKPIALEIGKILQALPPRFNKNLATVCESHHEDQLLEKEEYFPLYQSYGRQGANVQYAALLLRTVDLLHVTKDRTPSVMYKLIQLTDPKGVDEWKKQRGTFSVHMKSREFAPNDTSNHIIVIGADFDEERPFFALTEYINYANEQITQTKRWADISQNKPDGKFYTFPWHTVEGDIQVEGNEPVPMRFQLDRGRLLDLLVGHTIYNDPTVAVRELLQNSIDAVRYQHYLDKKWATSQNQEEPAMGKVLIKWHPVERELIVEDNGIGMDLNVIKFHLMRVGASYYSEPQFQSEFTDFTPISRFGIGVLTCFMISDDIEFITCRQDGGFRIRMSSVQADYLLKKLEPGDSTLQGLEPHGTRVKLRLRSSINMQEKTMINIIRHWIILPACEVLYMEDGKEALSIGFKSPKEALHYYHFEEDPETNIPYDNYEILQKEYTEDNEVYQLAYLVHKEGMIPERSFALSFNRSAPAVCIEGIRVDDVLPGSEVDSNLSEIMPRVPPHPLCGLLSVRGNKNFRTTVSRITLERDEAYFRVAKIFIKLMFSHIEEEVDRIANKKDKPLSQASTAARLLFSLFYRSIRQLDMRNYLISLYRQLNLIVIEEYDYNANKINRKLINTENFSKIEKFWTIESRLVDYLGIISRDLGRELSLNDFLNSFAPDYLNPQAPLLVIDAHYFREILLERHTVVRGEFSHKNQQTILEWCKKEKDIIDTEMKIHHNLKNHRDLLLEAIRQYLSHTPIGDRFLRQIMNNSQYNDMILYDKVILASITGDVDEVDLIRTRIINVISPQAPISGIIESFNKALLQLMGNDQKINMTKSLLLGYTLLVTLISQKSRIYPRRKKLTKSSMNQSMPGLANIYGEDEDLRFIFDIWTRMIDEIEFIFKGLNLEQDLPRDLESLWNGIGMQFDASDYWRDWERQGRGF